VISAISSLSSLPINETGNDFIAVRTLILPLYCDILNDTKNNIHLTIQDTFSSVETKQINFIIGQSAATLLFAMLVIVIVCRFFEKMKIIIITILEFDPKDIERHRTFWCNVLLHF